MRPQYWASVLDGFRLRLSASMLYLRYGGRYGARPSEIPSGNTIAQQKTVGRPVFMMKTQKSPSGQWLGALKTWARLRSASYAGQSFCHPSGAWVKMLEVAGVEWVFRFPNGSLQFH